MPHRPTLVLLAATLLCSAPVAAQQNKDIDVTDVVTQPAKDLNLMQDEVPPILVSAFTTPYETSTVRNCAALRAELAALDAALGADFDTALPESDESRAANAAVSTGGRILSGMLLPFRGVVREVSGSAAAERRYEAAAAAGMTRRGFLKGLGEARKCANARPINAHNVAARQAIEAKAARDAKEAAEEREEERAEAARKAARND